MDNSYTFDETKDTNTNKLFIGILIIIVFVACILALLATSKKQSVKEANTIISSKSSVKVAQQVERLPSKGALTVSFSAKDSVKAGQLVRATINLNSAETPVTGYDILMSYDNSMYEFKSAKTLNESFRVSPFNNDNIYITFTGYAANTGAKAKSINGNIIEATFVAKKDAKLMFNIADYITNNNRLERTNFIDSTNAKFTPIIQIKK